MARTRILILSPAAALLLSGCIAGLAAGAVGMAADRRGSGSNSEFMQAAARQACSARAAQYGTVHVAGVRQADVQKIVVAGTVTDASRKLSFECSFVTEVIAFELRPFEPRT